jgi:hypothetical protein
MRSALKKSVGILDLLARTLLGRITAYSKNARKADFVQRHSIFSTQLAVAALFVNVSITIGIFLTNSEIHKSGVSERANEENRRKLEDLRRQFGLVDYSPPWETMSLPSSGQSQD